MIKKAIVVILFLSLTFTNHEVYATKNEKYNVQVSYVYNNNPIYSVQIVAKNYQRAQLKLERGQFTKKDFNHFSVSNLKKTYQVNEQTVNINDKLIFGRDIKLSKAQATQAIEELYATNVDFLDYINEFGSQVTLHNPDNPKYKFSNTKGISEGLIQEGVTVFVSSADPKTFLVRDIQSNQNIDMGNTLENRNIILSTGFRVNSQKNQSVDYGQEVIYKIPINDDEQLILDVSPNFVIDSINYPYQKEQYYTSVQKGENGRLVETTSLNTINGMISYTLNKRETEEEGRERIAKQLANLKSINRLIVDLKEKNDSYLEVKGHIASQVTYQLATQIEDPYDQTNVTIKQVDYQVFNNYYKQGILIHDGKTYSKIPQVTSFKINFANFDASKNHLQSGGKYVLGRIDDQNNFYLYQGAKDGKPIWQKQKTQSKAKQSLESNSTGFVIQGNQIYGIDGNKLDFNFDENVWDFNEKSQEKMHESLFHLNGLSGPYQYVLYQVDVPEGYRLNSKPIRFEVGKNSHKEAQFDNYKINGQIIDMEYGQNEYNALALIPKKGDVTQPFNPYVMVVFGVAIMFSIIFAISYILLKSN